IIFLHILAMVSLAWHDAKEAFLEDGIAPIPQGQSEDQDLIAIAPARERILAPAESARTRVVVREIVPGLAVGAVILAHRAPGAFGNVGAPLAPRRHRPGERFLQTQMLFGPGHGRMGGVGRRSSPWVYPI